MIFLNKNLVIDHGLATMRLLRHHWLLLHVTVLGIVLIISPSLSWVELGAAASIVHELVDVESHGKQDFFNGVGLHVHYLLDFLLA